MSTDRPQDRFEALLEQHRGIVGKVAGLYCHHAEDRRDLAQEIRAQLWRSFPRYDSARPFATWMYRVALNVAISFARNASARGRHFPARGGEDLEGLAERDDGEHEGAGPQGLDRVLFLQRFLEGQGELDRALLLLYMEEHSYRAIAEAPGISETNVATKLSRLKLRLRRDALHIEQRDARGEPAKDGGRRWNSTN